MDEPVFVAFGMMAVAVLLGTALKFGTCKLMLRSTDPNPFAILEDADAIARATSA